MPEHSPGKRMRFAPFFFFFFGVKVGRWRVQNRLGRFLYPKKCHWIPESAPMGINHVGGHYWMNSGFQCRDPFDWLFKASTPNWAQFQAQLALRKMWFTIRRLETLMMNQNHRMKGKIHRRIKYGHAQWQTRWGPQQKNICTFTDGELWRSVR